MLLENAAASRSRPTNPTRLSTLVHNVHAAFVVTTFLGWSGVPASNRAGHQRQGAREIGRRLSATKNDAELRPHTRNDVQKRRALAPSFRAWANVTVFP